MTQPPRLSLRVTMERSEFLPGEPVLVGLSVENRSREPFRDLAPFSVELGFLSFSLSKNGGEPFRTNGSWAAIFKCDRTALAPGSRGSGTYVLKTGFQARLPCSRLRRLEVEGNDLVFSVRDSSKISRDEAEALKMLQRGFAGRKPSRERWNEIRDRLIDSGYFSQIEGIFLAPQDSLGLERVASTCLAKG